MHASFLKRLCEYSFILKFGLNFHLQQRWVCVAMCRPFSTHSAGFPLRSPLGCGAWSRNCAARPQLPRGTWDPPGPGIEPVSPALAGRGVSSTGPPQTSFTLSFKHFIQFGYKLYLLPQCCLHQKLLILIKSNSLIFDNQTALQ